MALTTASLSVVDSDADLPTFGPVTDQKRDAELQERERRATEWMMTALKVISQRTLIALSAIEHLLLGSAVFALWLRIITDPTNTQLIGGSIFSAFILAVIWLRRK